MSRNAANNALGAMSYFITPPPDVIASALESWEWLELKGSPIVVTAFADVFFSAPDGIWFLDTLEGTFTRTHNTKEELDAALLTTEGQDLYLFGAFVDQANREGLIPGADQCLDFKVHPKIGGAIDHSNVHLGSFLVALHLRGQLHEQLGHLPAGAPISGLVFVEEPEQIIPATREPSSTSRTGNVVAAILAIALVIFIAVAWWSQAHGA